MHREFKPTDILLDRHGIYKLADFGIAREDAQRGSRASAFTGWRPSHRHPTGRHRGFDLAQSDAVSASEPEHEGELERHRPGMSRSPVRLAPALSRNLSKLAPSRRIGGSSPHRRGR